MNRSEIAMTFKFVARTAAHLLGMPMVADHMEEALSKFDHSSEEVEADLF